MPEIKPDLSDESRCISVHWSLPVQCVLPCTHRENWHETWHSSTGNRIRYRRSMGIFRTEELRDGTWNALEIPPPGKACGEPHTSQLDVFCEDTRGHGWTHHALVDGCRYTWHPARRELTPEQVTQDLSRSRQAAAAAEAKLHQVAMVKVWTNEDGKKFVFAEDLFAVLNGGERP